MSSSVDGRGLRRALFATLGLVAALGALVMASAVSAGRAPYRILFVTPTSGPLGFVGKTEANGYQAGINVVNRRGGILGARAELKVVDDAGSGARAVAAVQQETGSTNYNLISCGSFGDDGLPCAAAIARQRVLQIPAIAESQLNDRRRYPYTFNAGGLFEPAEEGMVREMRRRGIRRFAIVVGDNATGRTASGILERAAQRLRVTVTRKVFVPVGTADATPQVQQAQASDAQAMAITGFTPPNIPVLRARAKLGWAAPVYCDWYCANGNFASMTEAERRGIITQVWPFMIRGHRSTRTRGLQDDEPRVHQAAGQRPHVAGDHRGTGHLQHPAARPGGGEGGEVDRAGQDGQGTGAQGHDRQAGAGLHRAQAPLQGQLPRLPDSAERFRLRQGRGAERRLHHARQVIDDKRRVFI